SCQTRAAANIFSTIILCASAWARAPPKAIVAIRNEMTRCASKASSVMSDANLIQDGVIRTTRSRSLRGVVTVNSLKRLVCCQPRSYRYGYLLAYRKIPSGGPFQRARMHEYVFATVVGWTFRFEVWVPSS